MPASSRLAATMPGASGHSSRASAVPTRASLARLLPNSNSERPENSRLAPASGEIRSSFGRSGSPVQTTAFCSSALTTGAAISARSGRSSAGPISPSSPASSRASPSAVGRQQVRLRQEDPPGRGDRPRRRRERRRAHSSAAAMNSSSVWSLAGDHELPLGARLVEPPLRRRFGLLRWSCSSAMVSRPAPASRRHGRRPRRTGAMAAGSDSSSTTSARSSCTGSARKKIGKDGTMRPMAPSPRLTRMPARIKRRRDPGTGGQRVAAEPDQQAAGGRRVDRRWRPGRPCSSRRSPRRSRWWKSAANSRVSAAAARKAPGMVPWVASFGSNIAAADRPDCRAISDPPTWIAASASRVTKPSSSPTRISGSSSPARRQRLARQHRHRAGQRRADQDAERQRQQQPQPRQHVLLAEARHGHQRGAQPREHQQHGERFAGQEISEHAGDPRLKRRPSGRCARTAAG